MHHEPHHQQEPLSADSKSRDRSVNANTLVIGAFGFVVSVLLTVLGFIGANIISKQDQTQTDVTAIKASIPYIQQQIDAIKESQGKMWDKIGGGDPPDGGKISARK
jgi:hypothetical protein